MHIVCELLIWFANCSFAIEQGQQLSEAILSRHVTRSLVGINTDQVSGTHSPRRCVLSRIYEFAMDTTLPSRETNKTQREASAATRSIFNRDHRAVQVGDALHDRETKAGAARSTALAAPKPAK